MVGDQSKSARVAALWMLHGTACVRLLEAHGRDSHAVNLNAALTELQGVLAAEFGPDTLRAALDWASAQMWEEDATPGPTGNDIVH